MRRFGEMGPAHRVGKARIAMKVARHQLDLFGPVYVRAYERFRFGKVEHVRAHTRSWPS